MSIPAFRKTYKYQSFRLEILEKYLQKNDHCPCYTVPLSYLMQPDFKWRRKSMQKTVAFFTDVIRANFQKWVFESLGTQVTFPLELFEISASLLLHF